MKKSGKCMRNRLINRVSVFGMYWIGALVLLFGSMASGINAAHWCYFKCAQNGVAQKTQASDVCLAVGEDPCVGTCSEYTYTANVTCYNCDVTTSSSTCTPGGFIPLVPASYYETSCGVDYLGSCICIEPWILRNNNTGFPCYTSVPSTNSACVVW
jgi:hypothetical protein